MSRKDYVKAAGMIAALRHDGHDEATLAAVTFGLADIFSADNPRFDVRRFVDATMVAA